jgi:hypothetical protein
LSTPNFGTFELQSPGGDVSTIPEPPTGALVVIPAVGLGLLFLLKNRRHRMRQAGSTSRGLTV